MKYNSKEISVFQEQVCKKICIMKGQCLNEEHDEHWYAVCPHFHAWKFEYGSFVWDQLRYDREHPEEAEHKYQEKVEFAKKLKAQRKTKKKS